MQLRYYWRGCLKWALNPNSNFKFYLELATRVQDERLLSLLRIPESASVGTGIWRARWWSHGKTTRMRSAEREKILGRVWQERINELDLKWQPENSSTNNFPIRLVDLWNSFTPEQMSVLWAPVSTEKLSSRDDERKRINFGGASRRLMRDTSVRAPQPWSASWSLSPKETH